MKAKPLAPLLYLTLALGLAAPVGASDTPPDKPVGLSGLNDVVGLVDLAGHNMPGTMADYDLRSRLITLAPGGAIHSHPHAGRPGIVLVTKGSVVEYRGTTSRTLRPGDSWQEMNETVHWFRNPSQTDEAQIWAVDLVAKKK